MTLIELTFLLFPVMGASCGAGYLGASHRITHGVLIGGVLGGVVGHAAWWLLWLSLIALIKFTEWWRPRRPVCRQGRCGAEDYAVMWKKEDLSAEDQQLFQRMLDQGFGHMFRCRCGDRYVESSKTRQVLEVRPDGTVRPFRYHKPFGRKWLLDDSPPPVGRERQ